MFCIYCGKEVVDYVIYCNHCGKYIGEITANNEEYDPELESQVDMYMSIELSDDYPCIAREFEPDDSSDNIVFSYGSFPWQDNNDDNDKDSNDGEIDFGQEVRVYGTVNKKDYT